VSKEFRALETNEMRALFLSRDIGQDSQSRRRPFRGPEPSNTMQKACLFLLAVFMWTPIVLSQDGEPIIKADVVSAFIWGGDSPSGAVSSTIRDPLTGNTIHKLSHAGIEVSSRMGFEGVGDGEAGIFVTSTTTIVNSTNSMVSVRYGGISADGHAASLLWVIPRLQKVNKRKRKSKSGEVELGKIQCFTSGFLPSDNFFLADDASQILTVAPGTALPVSSVIRDPLGYLSVRCSVAGCHPTGTIRYYVTVASKDYVFEWPGQSVIYCGK
jgi:hypothetical protein